MDVGGWFLTVAVAALFVAGAVPDPPAPDPPAPPAVNITCQRSYPP